MSEFIYRPPNYPEPEALNATVGVKFCQDTILLKSFLDQQGVKYDPSELEKTPVGLGFRIKKEKK